MPANFSCRLYREEIVWHRTSLVSFGRSEFHLEYISSVWSSDREKEKTLPNTVIKTLGKHCCNNSKAC